VAVSVRSVSTTTVGNPGGTATRGAAQPGDVLLAFQSADSGGNGALHLTGDWLLLDVYPGGPWPGSVSGSWAGCIVWKRICEPGEPTGYFTSQGNVADGVITIIAVAGAVPDDVRVSISAGTTAPSITPDHPSGLEIRYATGVPSPPGGPVSWTVPSGWTGRADVQADAWTTAVLATRSFASTAPVGEVELSPSSNLAACAITIVLESVQAPSPPAPPVVQPYAPGRGSSLYRYVFTRLLDRAYLGDLDLVGVSFDKRILQPGAFSATIPIPTRRIGDQVAEIIPRSEGVIDRGPGVITCQVFREGEPWGEYWITSAHPSRSRRGTPAISLRGSTLDAYLARVEIQEDIPFAADQIDIARNLLNSAMGKAGANISLSLQEGSSGVIRERTYLESEGGTYGGRLVELAQVDDGFEWMINLELIDGVLVRRWAWGYPKLGATGTEHLFTDGRSGGDILDWDEDIDALRGATRWRARGSSISTDASTTSEPLVSTAHEATAHLAAGWPRIDRTLNYSTASEAQTLEDYAAFWAATAPGALRVDQATVTFGRNPSFTPNHLGDSARFYHDNEWHRSTWKTRRIIGIGITPTSRASGKEEARLVLEGQEAPGA